MTNSSKWNAERLEALRVFPTPEPTFGVKAAPTLLDRISATLKAMRVNVRQRRELAELSEYALRDIDLSRAQVFVERLRPR